MSNNNTIIFNSYFIAKCDNTDNNMHKKFYEKNFLDKKVINKYHVFHII